MNVKSGKNKNKIIQDIIDMENARNRKTVISVMDGKNMIIIQMFTKPKNALFIIIAKINYVLIYIPKILILQITIIITKE